MTIPNDLDAGRAVFEGHFENLVGEVALHIEFVERFGEELFLEREVHAHRAVEANDAGVERNARILTFGAGRLAWSAKVFAIPLDQHPILIKQNSFKLQVLPAGLADPQYSSGQLHG